jgi:RNase P subunit RPR2
MAKGPKQNKIERAARQKKAKQSDAVLRMGFLYQASTLYASSKRTQGVSRALSTSFKHVAERNVIRLYAK